MLGINDSVNVLRLIEIVEDMGVDATSTGVVLTWITEAFEKGLINKTHTNNITFQWGKADKYGVHLGYLFGARHSHLDSAGYEIDKEAMKKPFTENEITDRIFTEEICRQAILSLVICFFGRGIYTPEVILKCLNLTGFDLDEKGLLKIGKEIYANKYRFKIACGFNLENPILLQRVFETPSSIGILNKEFANKSIKLLKEKIKSLL